MFRIDISDNQEHLWKIIYIRLEEDLDKVLRYDISHELILDIFSQTTCTTAFQAELQQRRIGDFIEHLTDYIYRGFNITDDYFPRRDIIALLTHRLYETRFKQIQEEKFPVKNEKEIPEDIKEALKLADKAMKYSKDIKQKELEIKRDRFNYYKKYWTFAEKSQEYIKYFLTK